MVKKTLYLGLNPPKEEEGLIHFPVIRIVPYHKDESPIVEMMEKWEGYTHLVMTSRSAVRAMAEYCDHYGCRREGKVGIAVGKATAKEMERCVFSVDHVAEQEQAEGVVKVLDRLDLSGAYILWPHSALSRNVLRDYFHMKKCTVQDVVVYDTLPVEVNVRDAPDLEKFNRIVFTSPSTVDAFLGIYGTLDVGSELVAIGPITREHLCAKRVNRRGLPLCS